ncbi:Uncharacterised protein [uncultured archaeon]|nr:Uncharacterised protein [uncultured archaeon]
MEQSDELFNILSSFKDAIDAVLERIESLEKEVHDAQEKSTSLEHTLYDEILNPAKEAMDANDKEMRFNDFAEKYKDSFAPYADATKAIEGDDFDLARTAFDEYDNYEVPEGGTKPDEAEFVKAFAESIAGQLDAVKQKLGITGDVKIEQKADGKTTVEAAGTKATAETPGTAEAAEIQEGTIDSPEDIAAYEKQLEEDLKKSPKHAGAGY